MSDTFDDDGGDVVPDENSSDCIEDDANFPAGADGDDDSVRVLTSPRRGDVEAPADDSDRWSKVGRVPSEGVGAETVDEPAHS